MLPRHAEADDPVAACIGGEIAADCAGIARAEIKAEEQPRLLCRRLNRAERRAGEHCHRRHDGIDFLDSGHAVERENAPRPCEAARLQQGR